MTTKENQEQHERLIKLVGSTIEKQLAEIETEELQDMEEEAESELEIDLSPKKSTKSYGFALPDDDTVVSWNPDGTPFSCFSDQRWRYWIGHEQRSTGFGIIHEDRGLDLSNDLCAPLVKFLKLLCFFVLPGNDPRKHNTRYGTVLGSHACLLNLGSLLKNKGYLYGEKGEYLGLSTISAKALRTELLDRIKKDEGASPVGGLAKAINIWISVSGLVDLPPEYVAPFSAKEMWEGDIKKKVAEYCASKKNPWDVIEFDDLVQMFKISRKYMKNYIDDVLFLGDIFNELLAEESPRTGRGHPIGIKRTGRTKEMAERIVGRQYAIDPETGSAWFVPRFTDTGEFVSKPCLKGPIKELESVCIFLLFIWTAMRGRELNTLKVDTLTVDGKPLDPEQSALEQVRQGEDFALTRVVTKTTKEHRGKKKNIPLPKSGAEAFAVLVDLYRKGRQETGNHYLLPKGDFGFAMGNIYHEDIVAPVSYGTVYNMFLNFCELADVKRYHPHRCRKTIATMLINHDSTCIELIRDLLCHEDIEMTKKYLMDLPGIAEDAIKLYVKSQSEAITEIITSAIEGKFAGAAGDRASAAILDNIDAFKGKRVSQTISILEETLLRARIQVVHTPMAWCLRFESRVPWDAPCLPPPEKRRTGKIVAPQYDKCQEWKCKFSGYTPSDLKNAKGRRAWAEKMSSKASSSASRAYYEEMAAYWEQVVDVLENGRPEIVGLHLVESVFAEMGA